MKEAIFLKALTILINSLSPELVEKLADWILDFIEEHVKGTISETDDKLVLPLCDLIRTVFGIEDD